MPLKSTHLTQSSVHLEMEDDEDVDSSEGGYTMEEVTKHNKKGDVWVVPKSVGHFDAPQDLGSEVVFWYVAHVHDHSPLPIPLRRRG